MKNLFFLLHVGVLVTLTGCQIVPTLNTNEISIIQGFGFDRTSEGKLRGTIIYPEYRVDESSKIEVLKAEGETVRETIDLSQNEVQYRLVNGQVRIAVIGEKLAEEGLFPLLDTFSRSPEIGSLIQLAIVEGEASELLSIKKYEKENIALYLSDMISQNAKRGELPTTDLAIFSYKYFDEGNDPYLPVLRKENGKIKITGMGLFKDDRLKTTLPLEDVFTLKMLTESSKMGTHQYKIDNNSYVVIKNINVSPRYVVKILDGDPLFEIKIKVDARIQEYTGHKSNSGKANTLEIQKKIKTIIEKDATEMIKFFQENDVDPLGLGAKYEAHNRDFDLKKWKEQYPDTKVNVHVDLTIVNTGISE